MNMKKYRIVFAAVALIVCAWKIISEQLPDVFVFAFSFPFEPLVRLAQGLDGFGKIGTGAAPMLLSALM